MSKAIYISALMTSVCWLSPAAQSTEPTPTFYRDILPILQENCQSCHRPSGINMGGMIAPMSLMTYEEVRPWAKAIGRQVKARTMPPWHASPDQRGVFENERTLTTGEIDTIVRWVRSGARPGNAADAPPPPDFGGKSGWGVGEPDLVIKMPEPFLVKDDVEDLYTNFEVTISEDMLPEPRWLKAHQVIPGSSAVHHAVTTFGALVPGADPRVFREGYSRLVEPGQRVEFQMHYHKEPGPGTAVVDQTAIGLRFYPEGYQPKYTFYGEPLGSFRFRIPPGDPNYSHTTVYTFREGARIVSFNPHMHLRGKAVKITAHFPDGHEELLLHVPDYDFNWQTTYEFKEYKPVPKGTRVEMTAWWDNSAGNRDNPDPTKEVRFGRPTTAEMMFGWMRYTEPLKEDVRVGGQ